MPIFVIGSDPILITNGFIRVWSVRSRRQEGNRRGRAYLVELAAGDDTTNGESIKAPKRRNSADRGTAAESAVRDEGGAVRA